MQELKNSTASLVFKHFETINQIPRCSHDEEKISQFMYDFGKKLGYETIRDDFGNVIIIKPATKGFENSDTVTLQSHLDMVCVKTDDSNHDFSCDPIDMYIDGDFIKSKGTTLGSDDGIGVALTMAILEDKELEHPEIEALFTTTEETGMDGVKGLSDSILKGKKLINLDNEEDWKVFIGCAGGAEARLIKNFDRVEKSDYINFEIKLYGLQGGHSGSMIHENLLNANKELVAIVKALCTKFDLLLIEVKGGSKQNAIPTNAEYKIGIKKSEKDKFLEEFEKLKTAFLEMKIEIEPSINIEIKELDEEKKYIDKEDTKNILDVIEKLPHGVNSVDNNLKIVKSSNNLAILKTDENELYIHTSIRSSDAKDMDELSEKIVSTGKEFGFEAKFNDRYPMWEPKFDTELLSATKKVYKQLTNEEIEVAVIHAGLETGTLSQKYPNIEMISIGPTTTGAHTPAEQVSITSVEFVFKYLKELLKNL